MLAMIMTIEDDKDRQKAEKLYRSYERQMFYAAKRILKDDNRAEDAVHNAFEGIIRNLHIIKNPESIQAKSYVIRAAKNSAINIYRKSKKVILLDDERMEEHEKIRFQGMQIDHDVREVMEEIYQLPQKYRDILILRALHGYSYKEISIAFHISESAAMKRMERAKKMLKQIRGEE